MAEIGEEVNIRIEITNDSYVELSEKNGEAQSTEEPVDMELELNENCEEIVCPTDENNTKLSSITVSLPQLEDGECSSASDCENPERMETDSLNGALADWENTPSGKGSIKNSPVARESVEGEISSNNFADRPTRLYPNPFVSEEAKKRAVRALRFPDSPFKFELVAEKLPKLSDEELLDVYISCGVVRDDGGQLSLEKAGSQYRLDSVLIRGINNMSTEEVFSYLYNLGLIPQSMEWVNDACCIVIYKDKYESAASLLKATKPIEVDPQIIERKKSLLIDEIPPVDSDLSNLKDSVVEPEPIKDIDYENSTVIPHEKVTVPMPLGYIWRYAKPCEKANGVLMRFATSNDKKQERAEKHSEYYKRHGNPNNPNYRPSDERFKSKKTYKRARLNIPPDSSSDEGAGKEKKFNAWSVLSKDWSNEEIGRPFRGETRVQTPIPRRMDARSVLSSRRNSHSAFKAKQSKLVMDSVDRARSVFDKLGKFQIESPPSRKRVLSDDDIDDDSDVPTRRDALDDGDEDDDDEEDSWTSRLSGPRMRMHADEEEERIKLQAVRKHVVRSRLDRHASRPLDGGKRRPVKERLGYLN